MGVGNSHKRAVERFKGAVLEIPGVGGISPLVLEKSRIHVWLSTCALLVTIPLWFAYLVITSIVWLKSIPLALILIATVGQYLMTWLGYMRHELWHNYFPGINNQWFFNLVAYLLWTDPKIYGLAHITHHRDLHTTKDMEFFCENYETNPFKRKIQFIFELLFGNIAWEISMMYRLTKSGQLTLGYQLWMMTLRIALLVAACFVIDYFYPRTGGAFAFVFLFTIWLGAILTRHDQWIEHLGINSKAPLADRIRLVRNLPDSHWTNRLWNFLNHNDPRGHYFHHAYPQLNMRVVSGQKLPEGIPTITIPQYFAFLWNYFKTL